MQLGAKPGLVGAFIPQCKDSGEFEEKQCWGSTGYCWCVDENGSEIQGTKTRGDPKCKSSGKNHLVEPRNRVTCIVQIMLNETDKTSLTNLF